MLLPHWPPQGYIPIAFVANFPGVARFGVELQDIVAGVRASEMLQVWFRVFRSYVADLIIARVRTSTGGRLLSPGNFHTRPC